MKKLFLSLLIIIGSPVFIRAQPIVKLWDKTLGGSGNDFLGTNIIVSNHNQIIIACESNSDSGFDKTQNSYQPIPSPTTNNVGTWLISLDKYGNKLWDKVVGGRAQTLPTGLAIQNSNSFYLTASIQNQDTTLDLTAPVNYLQNTSETGVWILNFDSLGNQISNSRHVSGNSKLLLNNIIVENNDIYLFGTAQTILNPSFGDLNIQRCSTPEDLFLSKVNLNSNQIIFSNAIGGTKAELGACISKGKNNSKMLGGITQSNISCNQTIGVWPQPISMQDIYVLNLDSSGNILWQMHYGGGNLDVIGNIINTSDGGHLLYGKTKSDQGYDVSSNGTFNGTGLQTLWVLKIDSIGNKIWDKRFGSCNANTLMAYSGSSYYNGRTGPTNTALPTSDGGFIFLGLILSDSIPCGDVSEPAIGPEDIWLLKIDSVGNKVWDKRYGTIDGVFPTSIAEIEPSVYVVTSSTTSGISGDKTEPSRGQNDLWLVCFKDTSLLTNTNEITQENIQFNLWPNPTNETLTYSINNKTITQVEVLNMLGEIVMQIKNPTSSSFNISDLQNGSYILRLITDKKIKYNKRFMVLR